MCFIDQFPVLFWQNVRNVFFFVQKRERMHLRTLCGSRSKQYPTVHGRNTLNPGVLLFCLLGSSCGLSLLPLQGCLSKSRTPHSLREMVSPGISFFLSAQVALRFAGAGSRSVPLCATFLTASAPIGISALGDHMDLCCGDLGWSW